MGLYALPGQFLAAAASPCTVNVVAASYTVVASGCAVVVAAATACAFVVSDTACALVAAGAHLTSHFWLLVRLFQ